MLESLLDQISGLGEVRRKSLLTHFGSVTALKSATLSELSAVPGIGEKMAKSIIDQIKNQAEQVRIDMQSGEILDA
jgi:excinuclease ABC subunit C